MIPLDDIVVIRRLDPIQESSGGLILAWDSDYKEDFGEVVYAGAGKRVQCSHCGHSARVPMQVKPGDKVLFSTHGHQIQKLNGEELVVLRQPSIIAILEGEGFMHKIDSHAEELGHV